MTDWIIFLILSLVVLAGLLYLSHRFNESAKLLWAMFLLIGVSVCSGRWHQQYMTRWYQVKFEAEANEANEDTNHLRTQIHEYNHHDNAHSGIASFKTYYRSPFALGRAQDDSVQSTRRMIGFPIKRTIDPKSDFKERQRIGKRQIKIFDSHKYVGQGYKTDHTITGQ